MDLTGHSAIFPVTMAWPSTNADVATLTSLGQSPGEAEARPPEDTSAMLAEGSPDGGARVKRHRFTPEQMRLLKTVFEQNPMPSTAELRMLSNASGVPLRSCRLWFKNRRARAPGKRGHATHFDVVSMSVPTGSADAVSSSTSLPAATSSPPTSGSSAWNGSREASRSQAATSTLGPDGDWSTALQRSSAEQPAAVFGHPKRPRERGSVTKKSIRTKESSKLAMTAHLDTAESGSGDQALAHPMPVPASAAKEPLETLSTFWGRLPFRSEPPAIMQSPHRSTALRIPPTPRLLSQRIYEPGEFVELLEFVGAARAWCPTRIVSANVSWPSATDSLLSAVEIAQDDGIDRVCEYDGISPLTKTAYEIAFVSAEEALCMRSKRAPNTEETGVSADPQDAQTTWRGGAGPAGLHRVVLGARLRPCPPPPPPEWRPNIGDAVEALVPFSHRRGRLPSSTANEEQAISNHDREQSHPHTDSSSETGRPTGLICCWTVGQVRSFLARKGFLVAFADNIDEWFRLDQLRPYAIWRGAEHWQIKSKAPPAVLRRAIGAAPSAEQSTAPRPETDEGNRSTLEAAKRLAALNATRTQPVAGLSGTGAATTLHPQRAASAATQSMYPHRAWYTQDLCERDESERFWSGDDDDDDDNDNAEGVTDAHDEMVNGTRSEYEMRSSSTSPLTSPLAAQTWDGRTLDRFRDFAFSAGRSDGQRLVVRKRKRHRGPRGAAKETLRTDRQTEVVAGQSGLVVGAGASDRRHRGGRKPSLTLTLPAGWRLEEQIRKGGSLAGRIDRVYVSPDGRRFRSLKEVARFLDR
ncbi:hypothetical protein F1559_001380 [Cyanidiococcus yangmingshanensis]|uniref:Homeobox domain-containing protein n=1 Tax=Cyanidiococcus yangmingshanensis TaxID=2690220 RepID=A0A7J7INX0_9RHOD|nr:hypothetical protein F1559_001380 [Cyanidiococcus yangmingshanensis]